MITEIDGERLWRAWARERVALQGTGTKVSEAKMIAIKRMPSSVLEPHQQKVVNYRTMIDAKDAINWYMVWARPTEKLPLWQRPLLLLDQIRFSVTHVFRKLTTRHLETIDQKLESELFMKFFNEEMFALYQQGNLTIGALILGQPSLFLGE